MDNEHIKLTACEPATCSKDFTSQTKASNLSWLLSTNYRPSLPARPMGSRVFASRHKKVKCWNWFIGFPTIQKDSICPLWLWLLLVSVQLCLFKGGFKSRWNILSFWMVVVRKMLLLEGWPPPIKKKAYRGLGQFSTIFSSQKQEETVSQCFPSTTGSFETPYAQRHR